MKKILFVTGLSGAGLSTSLKYLEDTGYEVFDNFPLYIFDSLLETPKKDSKAIAVGIDSRTRDFSTSSVLEKIRELINRDYDCKLLFIDCDDGELQKRFNETRRKHPMAKDRPVTDGIRMERNILRPLQKNANLIIDTTKLSVHSLRNIIKGHFDVSNGDNLTITVMSFGFKNGAPREADIIMDVRFLANPHWIPELKSLKGIDKEVGEYIEKDSSFSLFIDNFKNLMQPLFSKYKNEGKSYLTIAFGCTGGHHRSVFCAKTIKYWIEEIGYKSHIYHRDIDI